MTKDYNLTENPTFCMLGLLHTYVGPNGNVMPCCVGDMTKEPLGNINQVSDWEEIWNGEKYKEFRKNMIEGKKNAICSFCYDTEKFTKNSSRTHRNAQYAEQYDEYMKKLLPTGELRTNKLKYIDFRFSNKCNQACITCGWDLSSSWYDLAQKLNYPLPGPKFLEPTDKELAYKLIDDNVDSITEIYFAGGEPMLSEYHWYTLEKLIQNGRSSEVSITYSTNCSTLKFKDKDVLEYWKEFKSVDVMASIDEVGDRFNYIRWPGDWEKISENLRIIKNSFDQYHNKMGFTNKLVYAPVISSLNIHRLKEIVQEFIDRGIYQHNPHFEFFLLSNLLRTPRHLSIINMPEQHWKYVENKLDEFQDWYCNSVISQSRYFDAKRQTLLDGITKAKELRKMNQNEMEFFDYMNPDYLKFMQEYSKMDKVRNTDFLKTFPELEWLYK